MSGEIGIRNDRMQSDIFLIDYPNWETDKNLSDSYQKKYEIANYFANRSDKTRLKKIEIFRIDI